ncbi:MAG: hypothetical protein ACOYM3_28755 [Terrimicrobiaceae bacterium]
MIPITDQQRAKAHRLIDAAKKALAELAEARNIDHEAREAVNSARDQVSIAETIISNQPAQ